MFCGYLAAVILFGAWVRITHSGDGCGGSWPTCRGEVMPTAPSTETLIEFIHRVTGGLSGVFGAVLLVWAWRRFGWGSITRPAAGALLFLLFEGAIGAGLVLGGLTANDDSIARTVVIALHLVNTLALTACASLAARRSGQARPSVFLAHRRAAFTVGLALVTATAMSGAVTALGDTLFPKDVALDPGLFAQVASDLSAGNHFLVRLRVVHPALALVASGYLLWLLAGMAGCSLWARVAVYFVAAEVVVGILNLGMAAPGWMQILHLLAAQLLWISLILACESPQQRRAPSPRTP